MRFSTFSSCLMLASWLVVESAHAVICIPPTGSPNKISDYLSAMIGALERMKIARDTVGDHERDPSLVLLSYKTAQEEFSCAQEYISSYSGSSDDDIKKSAEGLNNGINQLKKVDSDWMSEIKLVLDGKAGSESAKAERQSDMALAGKKGWEIVMGAVSLSSFALLQKSTAKDGKIDHIKLNAKEHAAITRRLTQLIGKADRKKEDRALEVSALSLLKMLKQNWKFTQVQPIEKVQEPSHSK